MLFGRTTILVAYTLTVVDLTRKMNEFDLESMRQEKCSIMTQFIAFAISAGVNVCYSAVELDERIASYRGAIGSNVKDILTILPPIWVVMYAHLQTFRDIKSIKDRQE